MSKKIVEKNKSEKFTYFRWFAISIMLVAIIIGGVSYINTCRIIERAEKNEDKLEELFQLLRSEPEWVVATDNWGRQYIDSVKITNAEQTEKKRSSVNRPNNKSYCRTYGNNKRTNVVA